MPRRAADASSADRRVNLTDREWQVAQLVALGDSNARIAAQLGISDQTVKNHLTTIYTKIGFRGRVLLTRWLLAARKGEELVGVL